MSTGPRLPRRLLDRDLFDTFRGGPFKNFRDSSKVTPSKKLLACFGFKFANSPAVALRTNGNHTGFQGQFCPTCSSRLFQRWPAPQTQAHFKLPHQNSTPNPLINFAVRATQAFPIVAARNLYCTKQFRCVLAQGPLAASFNCGGGRPISSRVSKGLKP